MADGYWRYGDSRIQATVAPPPAVSMKRARPEYGDMHGGPEMLGYYPRDEGRVGHHPIRDTESVNASYDRYLRNSISSFGPGDSIRPVTGVTGRPADDPRMMGVGGNVGYGGGRQEAPLPAEASNTLFVEGLPADCTRREVSHIFRPFVGFREVRLVSKESRVSGGDAHVLCFVDFSTPSQAAVALDALQGYKIDEHEKESVNLRLQFARFPGPRAIGGPRGRR